MELSRYLVELERPAAGWADVQQTAAGAREAAAVMRSEGIPVRLLRSIFVPEDDACFFLYEGPSAKAVEQAAERCATAITGLAEAARLRGERAERA